MSATCLLGIRHPALRRQEPKTGQQVERGNLVVPLFSAMRDGCLRSSDEVFVMGAERREASYLTIHLYNLKEDD